jgi:hypothetical protein
MLGAVLRACSVMCPPLMNCAQRSSTIGTAPSWWLQGTTQRSAARHRTAAGTQAPTNALHGWLSVGHPLGAASSSSLAGFPALSSTMQGCEYDGLSRRVDGRQMPLRSRIDAGRKRTSPSCTLDTVRSHKFMGNKRTCIFQPFFLNPVAACLRRIFSELAPRAVQN